MSINGCNELSSEMEKFFSSSLLRYYTPHQSRKEKGSLFLALLKQHQKEVKKRQVRNVK
jgi:hypothetical protein